MRISDWSSDVCSSDLSCSLFAGRPGQQCRHVGHIVGIGLKTRRLAPCAREIERRRSEEHTSELQSLMRISYAVFCLKKKKRKKTKEHIPHIVKKNKQTKTNIHNNKNETPNNDIHTKPHNS